MSPTGGNQANQDRPWSGDYLTYTPRGRFRFIYSMLTPPLLLSTTGKIVPPILAIIGGAAWFTLTGLISHLPLWWLGILLAPLVATVLLAAMGVTVYREQVKNPTFPVGLPVDSYADGHSIWIRRWAGTREFPKHDIRRVRRGLGFAVIATTGSGSFVVPGALLPKDRSMGQDGRESQATVT